MTSGQKGRLTTMAACRHVIYGLPLRVDCEVAVERDGAHDRCSVLRRVVGKVEPRDFALVFALEITSRSSPRY